MSIGLPKNVVYFCDMKIKKLEIHNFRSFRQAILDFPESNLAVFIGVNGQGKSSLLDLIALFLTDVLTKTGDRPYPDFALKPTDIHVKEIETRNEISLLSPVYAGNVTLNEEVIWENTIQHGKGFQTKRKIISLLNFTTKLRNLLSKSNSSANVPVLNFYTANRHFDNGYSFNPKKRQRKISFPQFGAYEGSFEKKLNDFIDFISWYREEEDIENEQVKRKQDFNFKNHKLETLRKAIVTFFSCLGKDTFGNLRIERDIKDDFYFGKGEGRASLVISKNNQDFRLEQLSDGEKMLLMVVCDIARRLSIANPGLDDPLKGSGIVLIDEIELHLHPKWQREVIPALMATFPNIQFIVSTHSPQVLSRVDNENIFLLKDGEVLKLSSNPKGLDTNVILEEIMGTSKYPRDVDDLVESLFSLIEQRKFSEAEDTRKKIAELSPDNPVLQRADAMIERLKILN